MKIQRRHVRNGMVGTIALFLSFLVYKIFTDIESPADGIKIMENYIGDPGLGQLSKEFSIGGVFNKDLINLTDTKAGIKMWFCVDSTDSKNKKLFLAVERAMYQDELPENPMEPVIQIPLSLSKYDQIMSVEEFLKKDQTPRTELEVSPPPTQSLDATKQNIEDYRSLLKQRRLETRLMQMSNYAFFQNNKQHFWHRRGLLQRLYEQPGTEYIRYYFAYNPDSKSNKLRVLLLSVDSEGRNIVPDTKSDGIILQRSIPPN